MIAEIQKLHEEMKKWTLRCKVPLKKYDGILRAIDKAPPDYVERVYDFLKAVRISVYKDLLEIVNMPHINDTTWDMYELLGVKGMDEQEMLKDPASRLRKRWHKTPKRNLTRLEKRVLQETKTDGKTTDS